MSEKEEDFLTCSEIGGKIYGADGWVTVQISVGPDGIKNGWIDGSEKSRKDWDRLSAAIDAKRRK